MQNRNPRVEDIVLAHRRQEGTYWVINQSHPSNPTPMSNVDARLGMVIEVWDDDGDFESTIFKPGHTTWDVDRNDAMAVSERPVNEWDADEGVAAVKMILKATQPKAHREVAA